MKIEIHSKSFESFQDFQDFLKFMKDDVAKQCECPEHKKARAEKTEFSFKIWEGKEKAKKGEIYYKLSIDENDDLALDAVDYSGDVISHILVINKETKELDLIGSLDEELGLSLNSNKAIIIGDAN